VFEVYREPDVCLLSKYAQSGGHRGHQVTTKQWKIKPPVCLIKHPQSTIGCWGTVPSFDQTMDGGEWSALRPGHIYPMESASPYTLNNMRNEPQSWSGWFRHKYLAPIEIEPWFPGRLVRSPLTIPTKHEMLISPPPSSSSSSQNHWRLWKCKETAETFVMHGSLKNLWGMSLTAINMETRPEGHLVLSKMNRKTKVDENYSIVLPSFRTTCLGARKIFIGVRFRFKWPLQYEIPVLENQKPGTLNSLWHRHSQLTVSPNKPEKQTLIDR